MEEKQRFDIRFDKDAGKEYQKLKQPALGIVNKSIDELLYRADEVGKSLGNKRNMKLAGCREIKLREAGIRIIYKITDQQVDILRVVWILSIEKRSSDYVFKRASERYKIIRDDQNLTDTFKRAEAWDEKKDK